MFGTHVTLALAFPDQFGRIAITAVQNKPRPLLLCTSKLRCDKCWSRSKVAARALGFGGAS